MGSNLRRIRRHRFEIFVVVLVALGVIGFVGFYLPRLSAASTVTVQFKDPSGKISAAFELWLADSPQTREKGLMFVKQNEMPKDGGMLFVYPVQQVHTFWMKNTYLPLDMVFIDRDLKVVGVLHDVPILNEKPRTVGKPSMYIAELHAGTAKQNGIVEGSMLVVRGQLPQGK